MRESGREPVGEAYVEQPIDARRYVAALRRAAPLIAGVCLAVGVIVFLVANTLPNRYTATAEVAPSGQATTSSSSSSSTGQPNLATAPAYVTSPAVLSAAAAELGQSPARLRANVTASVDSSTSIVKIVATGGSAGTAAGIATGVARSFLSVRAAAERAQLARQEPLLTQKVQAAEKAGLSGVAAGLQQQLSELAAQEASAGSDLVLLAPALVPSAPASPQPGRDAILAAVAALFVAVLGVAGRELLAPGADGEQQLVAAVNATVVGRVPLVGDSASQAAEAGTAAEMTAYRFLAQILELMGPRTPRLIAVTSSAGNEGTTTVVSRLGVALSEAAGKTLLVSADMHRPALQDRFGLSARRGFSELAKGLKSGSRVPRPTINRVAPGLDVLTSRRLTTPPAKMLTRDVVRAVIDLVRELDYEFVLFDLPPLLAFAETPRFLRHADATLLASFVGRTDPSDLAQAGELLERLSVQTVGLVMLGVGSGEFPSPAGRPSALRRTAAHVWPRSAPLNLEASGNDAAALTPNAPPAARTGTPPRSR